LVRGSSPWLATIQNKALQRCRAFFFAPGLRRGYGTKNSPDLSETADARADECTARSRRGHREGEYSQIIGNLRIRYANQNNDNTRQFWCELVVIAVSVIALTVVGADLRQGVKPERR
jgi:hypothetical protein